MLVSNLERNINELSPKQPEFVLATSDYKKSVLMKHNISHFYHFNAESAKMVVIPDACVDILFCKTNGMIKTQIAGTRLERGDVDTNLKGEYFGIRFLPGVNPLNGIIKLSELVNSEAIFHELITSNDEKEQLMEDMFFSNSFEEKIKIFMNYYTNHFDKQIEDKNSLKYVLRNKIINSNGNLKLTDLSSFTNYSERYLNKKIHEDFGMNPKNLIRMIRFQKTISNLTAKIKDINCIDTALESGYYDQSHFNKEFKNLTGLTPLNYIDNLLCNSYDKKLHIIR